MKIDVSDIVKTDGASLNIEFNEVIDEIKSVSDNFIFDQPVEFKGKVVNISGVLKLDGCFKTGFSTDCYLCLKGISSEMELEISESFVSSEKDTDGESYTFEGNIIDMDKVLKDNIILNLPMKQACSKDCKGLCQRCGTNLNERDCGCKDDDVNPAMNALKDFFKN